MPTPTPCHSRLAAAPRWRPLCGAIVQLLLCVLPSAAAVSWDSSHGSAAAVDVHAAIAEAIVSLHPELEEEAEPVYDIMGPVADGRVREPVPPELQALLDRDPTFLAVADDDSHSMHDGDSGAVPAAPQTPWAGSARSLLHGKHAFSKKFYKCSRCYRVRCFTSAGFCTGHCKALRKLHWCDVPIIGPPVPPPGPPPTPDDAGIFINEINTVSVTAQKPYVGCTNRLGGGCTRPKGYYSAVKGKEPDVDSSGKVKAKCVTGKALNVRWYSTFVDDGFEDTKAGVCQCSYGGTEAACEVKGGVKKPEVDPRDPKPYKYPSQTIKVAGKSIKIDITSAAEQVDDPNEVIIGIQGGVAGCISDDDYEEDPPRKKSGKPVEPCKVGGKKPGKKPSAKGKGSKSSGKRGRGKQSRGQKSTGKKSKGRTSKGKKSKGKKSTGKKSKGKQRKGEKSKKK